MSQKLSIWQRYRNIGVTDDLQEYEKRSYYIFNVLIAIVLGITLVYAIVPYFVLHIDHLALNYIINWSLFSGYLLCIFLNYLKKPLTSRLFFTTLVQAHIFIFTLLIGWDIGNYLFYLALPALPYVIFYNSRFGVAYGFITGFIGFAASYYVKKTGFHLIQVKPQIYEGLFLLAFFSTFFVILLVVKLFFKLSRHSEERLNHEKKRSERLLLNILPEDIAARLQKGESTIADHYDPVVVPFCRHCWFYRNLGQDAAG